MDPSQAQSDPNNDVHSLEQTDGTETKTPSPAPSQSGASKPDTTGIVDATGGATTPDTPTRPSKKSPLKKFWEKFNIYLLLFILVVIVAVGILVALTIKSQKPNQNALSTQNLSQQQLQQLANTDVTVGNPKQVLTVQANAVFSGAVLVRSNLEVAGSLTVGGQLSLNNLTVTGATQLADVTANNLTLAGALNLSGALNLKSGISVSGNSNFAGNVTVTSLTTGSLQLNGDLNLTHHISAGGTTPSIARGAAVGGGGTVSLSGSDTAGSISINTGGSPPAGCFATITFTEKFNSTPHIVITPVGSSAAGIQYYIDRTTTGFEICTASPAPASSNFGFDYIALD